jgi:AraC family transcriptional regulator
MQQRRGQNAPDAPMQFVLRASSQDRLWSGIEAKIYETSVGSSQVGPIPHCCITMHLSAPIFSTCRADGPPVRRLQVRGDIDLLPPGSYAAWRDESETLMFAVTLHKALFCAAAQSMGINPDRIAIPPQMQVRDPHIEHIALALIAELESEDRFGRVYAESLGVALASHLLRRYLQRASVNVPAGISHSRIRRVLDYMHDNISKDLSLEELAQVANVSPSHLKVVFKEAIGMPVHQYIIRHRVERAVQLIARNDLPLTEIATLVGFSNQSHMARFTRRIAGASPAQFRSKERGRALTPG